MSAGETEVRAMLKRMLANGPLTALPGKEPDLRALLALGAARLEPGRAYTEREVNDTLRQWLESFCAPYGADHVTVRRYLVDHGLLARDKAGSTYHVDDGRTRELIDDAARGVDPAQVMAEVREERESRKRARPT